MTQTIIVTELDRARIRIADGYSVKSAIGALSEAAYEAATRTSESLYSVGLTGLVEDMADESSDIDRRDIALVLAKAIEASAAEAKAGENAVVRVIEMLDRDAKDAVSRAHDEITRAREELAEIERQLDYAHGGAPYRRIGRISGLDAGTVYVAFAAIESAAFARNIAEDKS